MSRLTIPFLFFSFFLFTSAQAQHTVMMKDGSHKTGKVTSIQGNILTVIINNRPVEIFLSNVRSIQFYEDEKEGAQATTNLRKKFKEGFKEYEYEMEGRKMISFPKIGLGTKDEGVVVVEVTIDKYGNVLRAEPGAPGTKTTDDKYLFVKAKSAAQQAKFDSDPTAPLSTTGKIYVTFP